MTSRLVPLATAVLAASLATPAHAGEPAGGSASFSASTKDGVSGESSKTEKKKKKDSDGEKWINRYAPQDGMGEIGVYGGLLLPAGNHELFQAEIGLPDQGWKAMKSVAPDLGVRGGYYPKRFLGIEAEIGLMPVGLDDGSGAGGLAYTARGHVIAQLARWSIAPFILAGAGALGISSDRDALGSEVDFGLHLGVGAKFFLHKYVGLRLDFRDIISNARDVDKPFGANHFEVLLGLSVTLGRKDKAPAGPIDTDGDGIFDPDDQCVDEPGPKPTGCPEPGDRDGDGFLDADDACPDEAGVEPDGCPVRDTDGDGILDDVDECVDDPETANGYQDKDGCPDEIPEEVARFTGVIEGIYFDTNKDTIKSKSEKILKKALDVMKKFPIRLKISGHTDSRGDHDHNMDLSQRRAESVKSWLVGHGIEEDRLETAGFGPDEPIDSNETKAGRAKNRRIEFALIK
jgi:outer membrane protein OmpA-like peptidoglycan-associated protein